MARPLGPLSRRILAQLRIEPTTAARLAAEFGLPVRELVVGCYVLRVAGLIHVQSTVREGGSWRAVAVYAVKQQSTPGQLPTFIGFDQGRHDGP